ncbi:MAG: hypothetical protein R3F53_14425 [Gammaproteobacteria bacterium]
MALLKMQSEYLAVKIKPNKDGYFKIVPFIKTTIDVIGFYSVLKTINENNGDIKTKDILSNLKNGDNALFFYNINEKQFIGDYTLKLFGLGYITYDKESDLCNISEEGKNSSLNSSCLMKTY